VSSEPRVKLRKAGDPEERVMPKKNKDFGSNWNPDAKDSVRLWTTDNMRWVWAPARVKVGDRFDFASGVYRVSESKGVLFVTQLRIKV
jgi:hypothetical protein